MLPSIPPALLLRRAFLPLALLRWAFLRLAFLRWAFLPTPPTPGPTPLIPSSRCIAAER